MKKKRNKQTNKIISKKHILSMYNLDDNEI